MVFQLLWSTCFFLFLNLDFQRKTLQTDFSAYTIPEEFFKRKFQKEETKADFCLEQKKHISSRRVENPEK